MRMAASSAARCAAISGRPSSGAGKACWKLPCPPEDKTLLETRFGYTLRIVLFGSLFAIGLGVPLGIWSATRPNSGLSRALSIGLAGLVSIPNFVLGLLVILALALWLKITTVVPDWTKPGNWIAPVMVLGIVPMASIARVTHASLVNILNEDYVRTARAKGRRVSG